MNNLVFKRLYVLSFQCNDVCLKFDSSNELNGGSIFPYFSVEGVQGFIQTSRKTRATKLERKRGKVRFRKKAYGSRLIDWTAVTTDAVASLGLTTFSLFRDQTLSKMKSNNAAPTLVAVAL